MILEKNIGSIEVTEIPEVLVISNKEFTDERGFFRETLNLKKFKEATGIDFDFVQCNMSCSKKGTIRGLHYQDGKYAQAKLVQCNKGAILDVAVDIRKDSPTFGKYVARVLSEENRLQLYIPRGFAHGFKALKDDSIIQYFVDNEWNKESERGVRYDDPDIAIGWNALESSDRPIVSDKDKELPLLKDLYN